jgi:uncharacterized protein with HEPN domain
MKEQHESLFNHLKLIIDSIDAVFDYLNGVTEEQFITNRLLQDACLMRLVVIGEYTAKVPIDIQQKYPEVEWRNIKSARNFYVHDYIQVDWKRTWETIKRHLQPFRNNLEKILKDLNRGN